MYNRDYERQQYEDWHRSGTERGWFDRAADEFRSWFGDEDAERRRRMDQFNRNRDDRDEVSRPSWQDRNYSGVSPRGYDVEERGRFGMDNGLRRNRMNRERMSERMGYGDRSMGSDYDTEYGGNRGRYSRYGSGNEELMNDYDREGYGTQQRGGYGRRFFNDDSNRDMETGMGWGGQSYRQGSMFRNRDDDSMYRRERSSMFGGLHQGRGPRNFQRSDERIADEVNQVLTFHPEIDASDIEVLVDKGIVTLRGKVEDRRSKRLAEDICEEIYGVREVRNELRTEHGLFGRTDDNSTQQRNSLLSR